MSQGNKQQVGMSLNDARRSIQMGRSDKIEALAESLFVRWMAHGTTSFTATELAKQARKAAEEFYRDDREQVTK